MARETRYLNFKYNFSFENGLVKEFNVKINLENLQVLMDPDTRFPEWAMYKNFKCPNCPHNRLENEFCPVALNLDQIIRFFSNFPSYDRVQLTIETNERTYSKKTSLQDGVSSLIGILMPTSGCAVMSKLKPMVRFHLPFSTLEETQYRVMSMYLLAQYFRMKHGKQPDWNMIELSNLYEDIKILNQNVCKRIADLEAKDTSINAVVVLNNFAEYVTFTLDDQHLEEMESLFISYWK